MHKRNNLSKSILLVLILFVGQFLSAQTLLKGTVTDAKTGETLPGVTIVVKNTTKGVITDVDGNYELALNAGKYIITASYISYTPIEINDVEVKKGEVTTLNIPMVEDSKVLGEVVVTSFARLNSEVSLLNTMKKSTSIVSGVSSQQITKNQDRDASEVVKRIPGISIIDGKFIISRGLSQRYNNVWINNSATPSTEADARAFSFDIIPSSQIDNIMIIKSPQPELPADFTGGFIKVATKSIPNENSIQMSYGIGVNTQTQFHDFSYNKGSGTDFLGFDNGMRELNSIVPKRLDNTNRPVVTEVTQNGFNNDWAIHTKKPLPDQRFSFALNRKYKTEDNKLWGLTAAVNYTNSSKIYADMKNIRFGVYKADIDEPDYYKQYTDNQYSQDVRLGGLANLIFMPNDKHKFELRNIVNQLGKNRYTTREGLEYGSTTEKHNHIEYLYNSRLTYSGQLAATHDLSEIDQLDWTAGYSYGNRMQPDRRMIDQKENAYPGDPYYGKLQVDQGDIVRDFSTLNENAYSFAANYKHDFSFGKNLKPTLKAGGYSEMHNRDYKHRIFGYLWNDNAQLPAGFGYLDPVTQMLKPENYGADKLYLYERTNDTDNYSGKSTLLAGYLALNIPIDKLNIYAGVRVENSRTTMSNYIMVQGDETEDKEYNYTDLFPSANLTYTFNTQHLVRFAYGKSVNRQEFREVSAATYYDFDIFSWVNGNPKLKPAYIDNLDLRYEFYPSAGEIISLSLFYKKFNDPIEWTFTENGRDFYFSYQNAQSADNYGVELDIKKSLDFINLKDFSLSFNGALIKSKVTFSLESQQHERAMQGQSPYIINAGLFYQKENLGLNANILYNSIGKRIVGIGRVSTASGTSINNNIPDMYEMPRNTIDASVSKKLGKKVEITAAIRDILGEKVLFKQFPEFIDASGKLQKRELITKEFKSGTSFLLTARISL